MCHFLPVCPYVCFAAISSAVSFHSQALMHSACYHRALKPGTARVRIAVWRRLSLLPHEGESLEGHCHSCPPYLSCPRGVRKRGTGLTTGPNPSWRSTCESTPAGHLVPEGHQPLPSSHSAHRVFPTQPVSSCLITCSSTPLHQAWSIWVWPSCGSENAIGVHGTWGDPVRNPAVYFFPVTE